MVVRKILLWWMVTAPCFSWTNRVALSSISRIPVLLKAAQSTENIPWLHVGIVGGGPSGLLLAHLLLQQENTRVSLFESRSDPRTKDSEQRAYALGIGIRGRTAIRQVDEDLWSVVKSRGYESERFQLHIGGLVIPLRSEKDSISKDGTPIEPSVLMYQSELCGALVDELERRYQGDDRFKIAFLATITSCDLNSMELSLNINTNSTALKQPTSLLEQFDVIVGADGVNSIVRNAIKQNHPGFLVTKDSLSGEFKVVRLDEAPPQVDPTSVSLLLPKSGSNTAFVEPTGSDGSCCILFAGRGGSAILSETTNRTAIVEELKLAFPQWDTIFDTISSQLISQIKTGTASSVVCNTYHYNGKAVLIGDAAHATGGVSGQGVNSALQDSAMLAQCVHCSRNDLPNALLSYSQKQVPEGRALYDLSFGPKPKGIQALIWAFLNVRDTLFRGRLGVGRPPLQTRLTTCLTSFADIRREKDVFYSEPFPCEEETDQELLVLHENVIHNDSEATMRVQT